MSARVKQGLLGQWYAVSKSVQVQPCRAHAVKALVERIVLWRDGSGHLACREDFYPHRDVPQSRGDVQGDAIACRHRGVAVDAAGTIVRVPGHAGPRPVRCAAG